MLAFRMRFFPFVLLLATVVLGPWGAACGGKKGGLVLAISTDMKAPKDVSVVSLTIKTDSRIRHNFLGRVTPDGEVAFPATIAIVEPEDPNATIRVRVVAFQEKKARVLRDVRTSVPRAGRTALLRVPLAFVNDGSGSGELPDAFLPAKATGTRSLRPAANGAIVGDSEFDAYSQVVSACPPDETMIDGVCQSDFVDSSKLPDFEESAVGTGSDPGACFNVPKAFANAAAVPPEVVDANCALEAAGRDPANTNFALATTSNTGECIGNRCYVPLDRGEGGWATAGSKIQFPAWVCRLRSKGAALFEARGTPAKEAKNPVCDATVVGSGPSAPDGGVAGEAGVPDGGPLPDGGPTLGPQLLYPEDFPSAVVIAGSVLYTGGKTRISQASLAEVAAKGQPYPADPQVQAVPWRFRPTPSGFVGANNTLTAYRFFAQTALNVNFSATEKPVEGQTLDGNDFAWAVPIGASAGIYTSSGAAPTRAPFPSQAIGVTSIALGATATDYFIGDQAGNITHCTLVGCDALKQVSNPTPIDGMVLRVGSTTQGFALARNGVHAFTQTGQQTDVTPFVPNVDTNAIAGPGGDYVRQIVVDAKCAYFSSINGLQFATVTGGPQNLFVASPIDRPILGIARGKSPGGALDVVYFTVFAALNAGGGVFWVETPAPCK